MSRHQTFVHCARFLVAASRRSLGRVAVPVWLIILSDQLPVIGLVSNYLTNNLIGHRPILNRKSFTPKRLSNITPPFGELSSSSGYVPMCYSAVCHCPPSEDGLSFDLHTLGTPLALILSQDQTLHKILKSPTEVGRFIENMLPNLIKG